MKRFYRFILFLNIIVILIFVVLFYKHEIIGFVNSQTGMSFNAPEINVDWIAFWKKDKDDNTPANNRSQEEGDNNESSERSYGEESSAKNIDERLSTLEGNTVIGINYSGMSTDPSALAHNSDRIVKVKVTSLQTVAYDNVVRAEITGKVKKTYKGEETQEIQIFAYGGTLKSSELKSGQIKAVADKTGDTSDRVNVLMDFCEEIKEGETYIIFAENNNGVLSPVSGNMSFFKVGWNKVTRVSSDNKEFSMSLGKFEKEYLK